MRVFLRRCQQARGRDVCVGEIEEADTVQGDRRPLKAISASRGPHQPHQTDKRECLLDFSITL